jgi:hypothetical protein
VKPLFTVHAGEFIVGCEIEKQFRRVNVWLPTIRKRRAGLRRSATKMPTENARPPRGGLLRRDGRNLA